MDDYDIVSIVSTEFSHIMNDIQEECRLTSPIINEHVENNNEPMPLQLSSILKTQNKCEPKLSSLNVPIKTSNPRILKNVVMPLKSLSLLNPKDIDTMDDNIKLNVSPNSSPHKPKYKSKKNQTIFTYNTICRATVIITVSTLACIYLWKSPNTK